MIKAKLEKRELIVESWSFGRLLGLFRTREHKFITSIIFDDWTGAVAVAVARGRQ